jgi:hypothetical protein
MSDSYNIQDFSKLNSRYQIHTILSATGVKKICEVGVDHGWNLTNLCKCKPDIAVAIDLWDYSPYYEFYTKEFHEKNYREIMRRRLEENECILPIRLDSIKAAQIFQDKYFDFIYIDASHDYKSVKLNIETYWPKLDTGRYMSGHDYINGYKNIPAEKLRIKGDPVRCEFGVKQAVDEFVVKHNLELAVIKDENGIDSWVIQKQY